MAAVVSGCLVRWCVVLLIPRLWIDHPYGEEEITLLEEELLPAMALFLALVECIDRAIGADQEAAAQALAVPGRR